MTGECQNKKLVSVVMPAFNAARYVAEAIESVLSQSYGNLELLVIDDASTDNTAEVISPYLLDTRVKLIRLENNGGVANARNCAIEEASGDYIAFLDADDIWLGQKIEKQIQALAGNDSYCSHTYYERFSQRKANGSIIKSPILVTHEMMRVSNRIGNSTGIYDCRELGKFYLKAQGHEDYVMWLDITKKTNSICVPESLMRYRVTGSSLSSNIIRGAKWHWDILRNHESLSRSHASLYMIQYTAHALLKRI